MKNLSPGIALLLLAPILGELVSGHQTLFQFINPLSFILSALPYGFGAIICRELMIRWGKGWFALVLLAIAYGIYEEMIVARSVWDPEWAELGALRDYAYWKGMVWTYAEVLIHFHLTISIVSGVVLAHLLYPEQRHESWVSDKHLRWCFIGLALWMPVLMAINPFVPPLGSILLSWGSIAALVFAARILPAQVFPSRAGLSIRPLWYGVVAAVNMSIVFITVFMLPEADPSWLPDWPVMFVFIAVFDIGSFGLILVWSGNGTAWDDRHKLALVIGMLAFYLVMDVFADLEAFGGLIFVTIASIWAFRRLWLEVQARYEEPESLKAVAA